MDAVWYRCHLILKEDLAQQAEIAFEWDDSSKSDTCNIWVNFQYPFFSNLPVWPLVYFHRWALDCSSMGITFSTMVIDGQLILVDEIFFSQKKAKAFFHNKAINSWNHQLSLTVLITAHPYILDHVQFRCIFQLPQKAAVFGLIDICTKVS